MNASEVTAIDAPEVCALPIRECGEPLEDVRSLDGLVIATHHAEDPPCCFLVRRSVCERLRRAQRALPAGRRLLFAEGLRRLAAQRALQDRVTTEIAAAHPQWDRQRVTREAALYVAPLHVVPPHSTGGAVDVSLAAQDGHELPMGSPLNAAHPSAQTSFEPEDAASRINRRLLCTVMQHAGFANYDAEWWHWSFGDRYWAYRTGNNVAIYNAIERSPRLLAYLHAQMDASSRGRA
jgi:zinc D-Ala-D-Ala dipeptidase